MCVVPAVRRTRTDISRLSAVPAHFLLGNRCPLLRYVFIVLPIFLSLPPPTFLLLFSSPPVGIRLSPLLLLLPSSLFFATLGALRRRGVRALRRSKSLGRLNPWKSARRRSACASGTLVAIHALHAWRLRPWWRDAVSCGVTKLLLATTVHRRCRSKRGVHLRVVCAHGQLVGVELQHSMTA